MKDIGSLGYYKKFLQDAKVCLTVEVSNEDALIIPGDILYIAGITWISKNSSEFGSLQKYDNTGALLWHKAYVSGHESTDSWTGFRQVITTSDNNLMLSGVASIDLYNSYPILQKTDLNGNPIWAKVFPAFDVLYGISDNCLARRRTGLYLRSMYGRKIR